MPRGALNKATKVAQLQLVREGEMTVQVSQPWAPALPPMICTWQKKLGRETFRAKQHPRQAIRVSYQVFADPLQLASLEARANANKSGEAVRGWATCRAGGKAQLNMTDRRYALLVSQAANLASLKATEGPVSCKVKWLEQPEGVVAICQHCNQDIDAHDLHEETSRGKWVGGRTRGAHYEPDAERIDRYYLCPEAD